MANGLLANAHESHTDLLWAGSGGFDTVHHDDTLTGMGTELYPLGVNSAILNDAPWLSAAKEIAPTQTLQPGQYIQALSSLTVSGYKNHCVAVKGGGFVFPTVDQLKEWVGTDYYLPTSSFENYTAYNENNITNLYNSAGNLINNYYYLDGNKLDVSAFTAWSSTYDPGETYTLVAGENISISSDDTNKTTTISFTGSAGGGDEEVNNVVHNNSATWDNVVNKLDASSYHELTAGTNIDIQNYVISSKDWTNEIKEASANAFNEATAANPTSSTQWNSCYETVNTNSGNWNNVSAKLDISSFDAYTANDETYLLKGGYNIGISSDDINKETTIYYTGTNGDEQVNQVVRQYSAAGTWLTAHQDWTNTITAASAYAYSQATAQIPDPFDPTYISGQIDNKLNKSESANFYPMTGNPSGFLTAHQDLSYISGKIDDKLDTTALENLSGEFYPMTGNPSGFLTAHQDISYLATKSEVNTISSYLSGAISSLSSDNDTYLLVGGNDINISSDDVNKTTTISFTGYNGDVEVNTTVQNNSATWNNVSNKLDTTAFSTVSGSFLTAHQSLTDYYKKTETSSKQEISAAIAAIPVGDPEVNNVVRTYSANGTWLTAHQSLADYQTTAAMTGYVPYSAVSALFDVVQTYSGKWLLNGDL